MRLTRILTVAVVAAAVGATMTIAPATAAADKRVTWKLATTYASRVPIIGTRSKNVVARLEAVSGGNIKLRHYEPGALVPTLEMFDAVSSGAIDAALASPGLWAGREPALSLFGSVPFGPRPLTFIAWFKHGGGKPMFEEIYHKYNIHPVMCGMLSPEASGWFREEITVLDDLKGQKMRFYGIGGKVIEKLGMSPQMIAPGDIYPALELGTIDATEFADPAIDMTAGFYQVAKHYYLPGWHQQQTTYELMVNMDKWNALSDMQKAQVETACTAITLESLAEAEAKQGAAMKKLQEEHGVTVHEWPDETLRTIRKAWDEVVAEVSAEDETFKKVYGSVTSFVEEYNRWGDKAYLKHDYAN